MSILHYTHPAKNWDSALPVGNGRLGGMVFGEPTDELIQLNEDSVWSEGFRDRNNKAALENLSKMREFIRNGQAPEAEALFYDAFCGEPEGMSHYCPVGDLRLKYAGVNAVSDYRNALDLTTGTVTTTFTADGVKYRREVFASFTREAIFVKLFADKPVLDVTLSLGGRDGHFDNITEDNGLMMTVSEGVPFALAVSVWSDGENTHVHIKNAKTAVITVSVATAYRFFDCEYQARRMANTALLRMNETENILSDMMARSSLSLTDIKDTNIPTDKRLEQFRNESSDNDLIALYWEFSKYLMIAGSYPHPGNNLPLNLQGIWNKDMNPPWGSKYTVNINAEMNYWAAEAQNLTECTLPLFEHIKRMVGHGLDTARIMYGARGAVCHHNTDIWGDTAPQDKWLPGTLWTGGLAWLSLHIWEHYLYTRDTVFLREHFHVMYEAALFFADFLTENKKGELVTSPSVSPENTYYIPNETDTSIAFDISEQSDSSDISGQTSVKTATLCEGPAMDSEILFELFSALTEAEKILKQSGGDNLPYDCSQFEKLRDRLPKIGIGKHGQIMEWAEDYDEPEPGHRHISHLFALFPGCQIDILKTPETADAARVTLERRLAGGGGHTGWSRAWLINMFARLGDGEKAHENIVKLLANSTSDNLFDMHPPFQIDGNFGGASGITECIAGSHGDIVRLFPALPSAWTSGEITGIALRGGFVLENLSWKDGKATAVIIKSKGSSEINLYCNAKNIEFIQTVKHTVSENGIYTAIFPDDGVLRLAFEI